MVEIQKIARAAVIIPAHNEAANIGRLLAALTVPEWELDYDIVVSCNACTDNTAEIVRRFSGVHCIDSEIPSKINALNRAETLDIGYPRVYVDADILIDHDAVTKLTRALDSCDHPALAAPAGNINTRISSRLVQRYYNVWLRSRYYLIDGYGSGVYALNQPARELFGVFPNIISDDGFVRKVLPPGSTIRVSGAIAKLSAPLTANGLIKIKTRSKLGNIQLKNSGLAHGETSSDGEVHLQPSSILDKLVYAYINTISVILAKHKFRNLENYQWQRDESSRQQTQPQRKKILVIASKGGHWLQLLRLKRVWRDQEAFFVSNDAALRHYVPEQNFSTVKDASMDNKLGLVLLAAQVFWKMLVLRPDVVISTGAAPGYFAILCGKLLGAKTVWVDSIANAEELSLAGKKVRRFADVWLTQWPELANPEGPHYKGSVF